MGISPIGEISSPIDELEFISEFEVNPMFPGEDKGTIAGDKGAFGTDKIGVGAYKEAVDVDVGVDKGNERTGMQIQNPGNLDSFEDYLPAEEIAEARAERVEVNLEQQSEIPHTYWGPIAEAERTAGSVPYEPAKPFDLEIPDVTSMEAVSLETEALYPASMILPPLVAEEIEEFARRLRRKGKRKSGPAPERKPETATPDAFIPPDYREIAFRPQAYSAHIAPETFDEDEETLLESFLPFEIPIPIHEM